MSHLTNPLRLSLVWAAAFGLLWGTASASEAEEAVYQVGVAKIDVTPAYPIRLNGFGGRRDESEGVTQRIWAKAIAIGSDEAKPAVLITLDSLGVREAMVDEVARRLKEKAGIERDRVAVTFSHSHTTPKLTNVCDTIFSSPIPAEHQAHVEQYTAELTDAMEKVALEALADRKPSTLSWGVGSVGFAINRRTPGGPVDHDLPILVVKSAVDGAVRAIYVSYACHCVTLSDNKISGDWSGYAQEAIERTHPGVVALVSIGCGSDSNPSSGVTGSNTAAAADQGAQICDEVDRLLAGTLKPVSGDLTAVLSHIDIPLNPVPTKEELETLAASGGPAGYNAEYQLAKLNRGEPLQAALDYPVQTWAFGDSLAMVFLAGEVCADYSLRLKAELDPARVWMHGYSNDFCAYIPSERLLKEGGYGGGAEVVYFALPNTIATGVEEKIIAQVHAQIPPQFEGKGPRKQASAQPWPLEEAVASIVPKPGFVVEVAAAEPLVADPVAIDFGPDGRLWVAEMPDYSRYADEEFTPNGSVRLLTDVDGDGKYDEATTFADGLRFPTDVKSWRNGVIVCDAPDVIYLEDSNGDGQADVRKVLLTGFETHNAQARVNSLRWGLDNWLYASCGLFGGKITTLLEPQNSPAVQQAAIEMLAAIGGDAAAEALLGPWRGYTPASRSQAFDVMMGSPELTSLLLGKLEAGAIAVTDLDALQRQRLANHPVAELQQRSAAVLASAIDQNRDKVVNEYVAATAAIGEGDLGRGRQAFAKHCSSCHRLEDQGHEVGPDLAALTSRSPAALIESILNPNRAVDERFRSYSALTVDGLAHAGILTGETSTSITLTEQQGKRHTLLRADLDALENTGKSLMPEGLEKDLTTADVADLIAYLNSVGPPAKKLDGNTPKLIAPDYDGTLWLLAESSHVYGGEITYEAPHRNIGYWAGRDDYVAWQVDVPAPCEYEVYLHWATVGDAAGNAYIFEGGDKPVTGIVASTGGYDKFQTSRIGRVSLVAGKQRLILRPDGPLKTVNLMDLRGIYLTPVGVPADRAISGEAPRHGEDAATAIAKLVDGLAVGAPQEYERIPAIWEHAIAAGRRNERIELVRVMDLSLPDENETLADWQAVVIGGGVVNGVSQAGEWPATRIAELLKDYPQLEAHWKRTLQLAVEMAANEQVHAGTRYDALRILGAGQWEAFGPALAKQLSAETNPELQMGLVSAIADFETDVVSEVLVSALPNVSENNRRLAIRGLLRTASRARVLLLALEQGRVSWDLMVDDELEEVKKLTNYSPSIP